MTGHGPGIMTIITGKKSCLDWNINKQANIAKYMGI